jgi:hypothetical protein
MRTIKVFSTETSVLKEINSSATTWGELQAELKAQGIDPNNMKGMVKESKTTLENTGAVLPTDNFTLFLTPTKVKSGRIII